LELAAVGDFMLDHEFSTRDRPFNKAFRILSKADIAFADLEELKQLSVQGIFKLEDNSVKIEL
jgi:hypothetical protein